MFAVLIERRGTSVAEIAEEELWPSDRRSLLLMTVEISRASV
jgi:hypothetical protein